MDARTSAFSSTFRSLSWALTLSLAVTAGCSRSKHSSEAGASAAAANASGSSVTDPLITSGPASLPNPSGNASGTASSLASFAGTWHAECVVDAQVPTQFITTTQTISAIGLVSIDTTYFTDKSCATAIIQSSALNKLDITAPHPAIAGAVEVTSTTQSLSSTVLLASTLATYQSAGSSGSAPSPGCDPANWKLNEPADVTACNVKVTYNLMKIVSGQLLFGLNDDAHNGLTAATRPVALDPVSALKPVDTATINNTGT